MTHGFILGLYELDLTPLGERRVQLPIRLGRSSLNDVAVSHRLVSEFHARIEEVDGSLCVRDLSSKNGVFVETVGSAGATRVEAQKPIALEPYGFEFLLSPLLRVRLRPAPEQDLEAARHSQARGSVLGNPGLLGHPMGGVDEDKITEYFVAENPSGRAAQPVAAPVPIKGPATARAALPVATPPVPATPAAMRMPAMQPAPGLGAPPLLTGFHHGAGKPRDTEPAPARPTPVAPPPAAFVAAPSPGRLGGSGPPSASPAVQAYASVLIEPPSGPLELPALQRRPGQVALPERADAGPMRNAPRPARYATVLEAAKEPVVPQLTHTAWEAPAIAPPAVGARGTPPAAELRAWSLEMLALRGLRDLAASLLPGQPVEDAGDVIRLITKLHDAMEMFCRCFIPVREACSRFIPPEDLEQAAQDRSRYRSSAYLAIERALDPREVAAALLDWRNDAQDAPRAVENILADLMLHQLSLTQGAIEGTRALLDELSPARIDAGSRHEPSMLSRLGLAATRERELWDAYVTRHAELGAAREAFRDLFGTELTRAYAAHFRERGSEPAAR